MQKISKNYQLGSSVMKERLKKGLDKKINNFFTETQRNQGSIKEWIEEYYKWINIQTPQQKQEAFVSQLVEDLISKIKKV